MDNRMFVEAVLYIARTGLPWRDLPDEFGSWNSVYRRFSRWSDKGVWEQIFAELAKKGDLKEASIDGTALRVHQHGAGAERERDLKLLEALAAVVRPRSTYRWTPWATSFALVLQVFPGDESCGGRLEAYSACIVGGL